MADQLIERDLTENEMLAGVNEELLLEKKFLVGQE